MQDMPYSDPNGSTFGYGEFFPPSFSVFEYNISTAMDWEELSKDDAIRQGFRWREQSKPEYKKEVYKIPDHIKNVTYSILSKTLTCIDCGKNYKIIDRELTFYREHNFPIPRKCPWCRHKVRVNNRNDQRLYDRQCMCEFSHAHHSLMRCPNEFETSYSPERKETIYCNECYAAEII
jgi:uncharacterized protein YbaR (Trm112 family)